MKGVQKCQYVDRNGKLCRNPSAHTVEELHACHYHESILASRYEDYLRSYRAMEFRNKESKGRAVKP